MSESFLQSFFQRLVTWHWGSPSDGELLALQDNELSGKRQARIQAHLKRCGRCRERAERIAREWSEFVALNEAASANPPFSEDELIAEIQSPIKAWSRANLPPPKETERLVLTKTEAERQAVAGLGLYIGQRAAKALLQGMEDSESSRKEKLAQAESTLRALIGRKNAAAVVEKITRIMAQHSESAGQSLAP